MAVIESQLDTQSDAFKNNVKVMTAAVDEFRGIERRVIETAQAKAPRYLKKGFISPRERLRAPLLIKDFQPIFSGVNFSRNGW